MDSDSTAHNHPVLIAQAKKIGVLQVVVSDEDAWNGNGKISNLPFSIPSTYCHYFHTQRLPSQELTFPWKRAVWLDFCPKFSILIYYSSPSSLIIP